MKKYLLLTAYVVLIVNAFMWAASIPYNAAPDESTHFNTVRFIAGHGRLPVFIRDADATYDHLFHVFTDRAQGVYPSRTIQITYCSMPYVGYIISAALVRALMPVNPHFATFYSRITSVLCYALFVYLVWLIAGKAFKGRPLLRYLFPWVIATIPQVTFLAGYTNNDVISLTLAALVLYSWFVLYDVSGTTLPPPFLFGAAAGLLIFAKTNYYLLFLFTAVIYTGKAFGITRDTRAAARWLLRVAGIAGVIAGGFIVRNAYLYGDPLGISVFQEQVRGSWMPPFDTQKISFLKGISLLFPAWFLTTIDSSVAVFDWMSLYVSPVVYPVVLLCGFIAVIGCLRLSCENRGHLFHDNKLLLYASLASLLPLTLLASLWNTYSIAYQAQGRYLFPALVPVAMAFCAGWVGLFHGKAVRLFMAVLLAIATGVFNLYCLYGVIRPHYAGNPFYKQFEKNPRDKWNFRLYEWKEEPSIGKPEIRAQS